MVTIAATIALAAPLHMLLDLWDLCGINIIRHLCTCMMMVMLPSSARILITMSSNLI